MTPKVLHLSTYAGNGGAGRAASSLHEAMLGQGVSSALLTADGLRFRIASELDRRLWSLQSSPHTTWRSPARFASLTARHINALEPDIVNLHWVTDGFLSVEEIGRIKAPIVWTMHDMWPFTGIEHYTADASEPRDASTTESWPEPRWQSGYTSSNRPIEESGLDLDKWTWERKQRHWVRAPHLVPVSTWLGDMAHRSALAQSWPLTVIPNVMPVDRFTPQDRQEARTSLHLPADSPLIAFTASAGISDRRKGWQHLRDALPELQRTHPGVGVIVIGPHIEADDPGTTASIHWQGEIHDDRRMARLIAAADVVAVPSETDNLPMTACEAQSCGRPVVAFDVGGLPDVVTHQATGYLARPFDELDFAEGLRQAIHNSDVRDDSPHQQTWGAQAREAATARWSAQTVVQQYLEVYRQVLA